MSLRAWFRRIQKLEQKKNYLITNKFMYYSLIFEHVCFMTYNYIWAQNFEITRVIENRIFCAESLCNLVVVKSLCGISQVLRLLLIRNGFPCQLADIVKYDICVTLQTNACKTTLLHIWSAVLPFPVSPTTTSHSSCVQCSKPSVQLNIGFNHTTFELAELTVYSRLS